MQGMLPVPKGWEAEAKENVVQYANMLHLNQKELNVTSSKVLRDCANTIHNTIEKKFHETFRTSYTETLTKIKDFKLQKRPTKDELQKSKRHNQDLAKHSIEKSWNETSVIR